MRRSKPDWRRRVPSTRRSAQELRTREHDLAGLSGRLRSLEELEAARAGFTDAARVLLAQANGRVEQRGAVADYLEVDRRYERAVEALLGDLLQHVVVPTHEHAAAGVQLLREQQAGRCGFVVLGQMPVGTCRARRRRVWSRSPTLSASAAPTPISCVRSSPAATSPSRGTRP